MPLIQTLLYGPILVIAFLTGLFFLWKQAKEEYYDVVQLFDHVSIAFLWGVIASRGAFILLQWQEFGVDIIKWISIYQHPGYIGLAGLVVGLLIIVRKASQSRWNVYELLDFLSISLVASLGIISVGNFISGVGFGLPTDLPIGMSFPGVFDLRHPVQLYSAVALLILFFVLKKMSKEYRTFFWYRVNRRTAQPGFVFSVFLMCYSVIQIGLIPFTPTILLLGGVAIEYMIYPIFLGLGLGLLWVRSGRGLPFSKK